MKKRVVLSFDLGQVCNDILAKCNLVSKSIKDEALQDIKASILSPDDPETGCIINRAVTEAIGKVKVACQRYLISGRLQDDNKLERLVASVSYPKKEVQSMDDYGHLLIDLHITTGEVVEDCYKSGSTYLKDGHTLLYFMIANGDSVVGYQDDDLYYVISTGQSFRRRDLVADPTTLTGELFSEDPTPVIDEVDDVDNPILTYEVVTLILSIPNFNLAVTDDLKSAIHKYIVDYVMAAFLQDQYADKASEYKTLADRDDYKQIVSDLNARDSYTMRRASFM